MRVQIAFATTYRYPEPVSFSPHLYRLFPRAGRDVLVQAAQFQTNADAHITYRRDLFDNEIASCFHPEKSPTLSTSLQLTLQLRERNPFGFLLAGHAADVPFTYQEHEAAVLAPYLHGPPPPPLPFWSSPAEPHSTVSVLVSLNEAFREHLRYERRDEGVARSAEETLAHGGGACRDFSVLLAATLRGLGLATRLASGYLVETGEREKRAEGALHAWVEVFLPGAGWTGLDPTNGIFCDHHHITTAVGLTPQDITPTYGRYFHSHPVEAQMDSSLLIDFHD